jgi:excisionase family DNA binding protein
MITADDALELESRPPTAAERANAAEAAAALSRTKSARGQWVIAGADGRELSLAPAVGDVLVDVLGQIARGDKVRLLPTKPMLTTRQAADILNVSRPFLSALLKRGEIPFIPIGSHRRVMHADLMAYKSRRDAMRLGLLDKLSRLGQEFDAT